MTIRIEVRGTCDSCGAQVDTLTSATTKKAARAAMEDIGWLVFVTRHGTEGGLDFCPDCFGKVGDVLKRHNGPGNGHTTPDSGLGEPPEAQ